MQLYLIEILHQTTTYIREAETLRRCILSKFYIKPQPLREACQLPCVVSYRNSTSNHNPGHAHHANDIVVSYRNSTSNHNPAPNGLMDLWVVSYRNSTSNHNGRVGHDARLRVVSYRNSTSNHNCLQCRFNTNALYLIEILHQTTTMAYDIRHDRKLYLIEILHQTTTSGLILIDKVLLTGCLPL